MAREWLVALVVVVALLLITALARRRRPPVRDELAAIFGEAPAPDPGPRARRWALGALHRAGVDAEADPVYAMRVLRQAEPRLSLAGARSLVAAVS